MTSPMFTAGPPLRIAAHHAAGGYRAGLHVPVHPWGDCYIQWGDRGVVFAGAKTYRTAFFEAFAPGDGPFIRGEGADIAAAEDDAWIQLNKAAACDGHAFERRGYRNGGGFCSKCGMFKGKAFETLDRCSICEGPGYGQRDRVWFCEDHMPPMTEEMRAMLGDFEQTDLVEAVAALLRDGEAEQ